MKVMRWVYVWALMSLIGLPIQAQALVWEGALYVEADLGNGVVNAELQIFNEQGVTRTVAVPINALRPTTYRTQRVVVSPDRRFVMVYAVSDDSSQLPSLRIADVSTGTCCVDVQIGATSYFVGEFDPTSTRFAFSYVMDAGAGTATGGLGVVNTVSGQVTTIDMTQVNAAIGASEFSVWGAIGEWVPQGVEFAPSCYACEGVFEANYAIWNPANGQLFATSSRYLSIFGDHLGTSDEFLFVERDTMYPYSFEEDFFLPITNVVKYASTGGFANEAAPVVYFNPDVLYVTGVNWVDNGEAFIASNAGGNFWDVVRRDGSQFRLTGVDNFFVLEGTPTGWLAELSQIGAPTQIFHYDGDTLQGQLITTVPENAYIEVVQIPQLNVDSEPAPFVIVPPPAPEIAATIQANAATVCAGLRSRIYPNTLGRVTPGTPNRLRQDPSTDGEIVGEIPGSGQFTAVDTAFCDEATGILWLPVDYQGQFGWTAEGQNGEYFTEPLP